MGEKVERTSPGGVAGRDPWPAPAQGPSRMRKTLVDLWLLGEPWGRSCRAGGCAGCFVPPPPPPVRGPSCCHLSRCAPCPVSPSVAAVVRERSKPRGRTTGLYLIALSQQILLWQRTVGVPGPAPAPSPVLGQGGDPRQTPTPPKKKTQPLREYNPTKGELGPALPWSFDPPQHPDGPTGMVALCWWA